MARGNGRRVVGQLSLDVVSSSDEELPVSGRVRVAGALRCESDVAKDAVVRVIVLHAESGEQIAESVGEVQSVKLTTKRTESGSFVERVHGVVLQA